jgi:spermidine synthase
VIPWVFLGATTVPGGGEMTLKRRGAEFSIKLGGVELMNSRLSGSEEAMATLAAERLAGKPRPAVLIGGLGMGFTLRAALAAFGPTARLVVAELVPAVVGWAKAEMAEVFDGCLQDGRVEIRVGDVGAVMAGKPSAYDAILLDVDNGPDGLTRAGNDELYTLKGLAMAQRALRPGGLLVIWSAYPDERFAARLSKAGYRVDEVRVKAHRAKRGARHVLWLATRP